MTERPLPAVDDPLSARFWSELRAGRIAFQRCDACSYLRWPISPFCPQCLAEESHWDRVSGTGTIWSLGVYEHLYHQAFASCLPYVVALVELDAGPRIIANILDSNPDEVEVGARVLPAFEAVTREVTLLQFCLALG